MKRINYFATRMPRNKVFRRAVEFHPAVRDDQGNVMRPAVCITLWFRFCDGQWEMAAAKPFTLRRKLRWRRLNAVLWDAFALETPPPPRTAERALAAAGARGGGA